MPVEGAADAGEARGRLSAIGQPAGPLDVTQSSLAGVSAHQLAPTGVDELVNQLNSAERWLNGWLWGMVATLVVAIVVPWALILTVVVAVVAVLGYLPRRVALEYEIDGHLSQWLNALVTGWPQLAQTRGRWRLQTSTRLHRTHQQKINAGASNLISRTRLRFLLRPPMALRASIQVPTLKAGRHMIVFLPDRLLVKSGRRWSDTDYRQIRITDVQQRFIESGPGVPRDGLQIDTTWQYVNVKGGPDRRFKNNRRLPVMLYDRVTITSEQGLSWDMHLSRHDVAEWWTKMMQNRISMPSGVSPQPRQRTW
jgi:hypothetical protein